MALGYNRWMVKKILFSLVILVVIVGSSWSLFRPEFFRVHDYIHAARISEFSRAWADGHVPVRWSENFGYGYGMPLFEFYAPLPYAVGALLWSAGLSIVLTIKTLYVLSSVIMVVGSLKLGRALYGGAGAVILATLTTLAPYRAVNLFVRGAVSEAWAMSFFPWMLLGILQVYRGQRFGWVTLTVSVAGVFLSHNLSVLMVLPFVLLFAVYILLKDLLSKEKKMVFADIQRPISTWILAIGLAVGIASFYSIPSYFEKDLTQVDSTILGGYFDFNLHFLYVRQLITPLWSYGGSQWGPEDGISFFLGYATLLGILVIGVTTAKKYAFSISSLIKEQKDLLFWSGCAGIALLLTTFKAQTLWQAIPLFEYLQFPWRFLSPAVVLLGLAIASGVRLFSSTRERVYFAFVITLVALFTQTPYFQPESYLDDPDSLYYTDPERIQSQMSQILPDFIPKSMSLEVPPTSLIRPDIEHELLIDRVHQKLISYSLLEQKTITIAIASYPGWITEIDGELVDHTTSETGLIQVALPEGNHTLAVSLSRTSVRALADSISGISILIFIAFLYREHHSIGKKS